MLILPENLQTIIGNRSFVIDNIGMSDAQVVCFDDMVLKVEKQREESNNEHKMMKWLDGKVCVPKVLAFETVNDTNYLLMSKIKGQMLSAQVFLENPAELIKLLAKGMRMLWSVNVLNCPCDNSIDNKLRLAEIRVANDLCGMDNAEPDTYGKNGFSSPADLLCWLKDNKPAEKPVLSHGDYCLPNIFAENGEIKGFIDLGRCGAADKYQDIALCYRSLKHNFNEIYTGRKYDGFNSDVLFDELEITPDWDAIRYYILLDELF